MSSQKEKKRTQLWDPGTVRRTEGGEIRMESGTGRRLLKIAQLYPAQESNCNSIFHRSKGEKWHPVNYKWCYMLPIEDGDSIVMSLMSVSLPEGMPQWGQERQKFDRRPGPFLGCPSLFFLNRSATKDWDPVVKLICPLVNQHSYRTSPLLTGRSTISMAIFNSKLLNYQRVIPFWSMNDFNYL